MSGSAKNEIGERKEKLAGIAQKIAVCEGCRLAKVRDKAVPGEGNIGAKYFIIGQGPGANEDKTGRPFIGRAGKLLTELLLLAGIDRAKETFITSIVKCLPTPPLNRKPKPDEIAACHDYLACQIELVGAQKIILLGDMAFKEFFPGDKFSDWRGQWRQNDGRDFFVSYHPAAGIRFVKFKKILENDFKNLNFEGRSPAVAGVRP
jgi:uracil-DNA glycosylase